MFACTAIRRGELVGLVFGDIDFARQTVTVRASAAKNHQAREIPLDDALLAMLAELREASQHRQRMPGRTSAQTEQQRRAFTRERVFVTHANTPLKNNLLRRFYAVCRRASIEGAHFGGTVDLHSLRVSSTTLMLEPGASPKAVQMILGHAILRMTMGIYAKATERGKRDAVAALHFATTTMPRSVVSLPKAHNSGTPGGQSSQVSSV
jgi:integrase